MPYPPPMKRILSIVLVTSAVGIAYGADPAPKPPRGWSLYEEPAPGQYEISTDRTVSRSGKASGKLRSLQAKAESVGALGQEFSRVRAYRGQRVQVSAYVRTEAVANEVALAVRFDRAGLEPIIYNDLDALTQKGTTAWIYHRLVVDIPYEVTHIGFALELHGTGTAWIDEVRLQVVDKSTPLTDGTTDPTNLELEE